MDHPYFINAFTRVFSETLVLEKSKEETQKVLVGDQVNVNPAFKKRSAH